MAESEAKQIEKTEKLDLVSLQDNIIGAPGAIALLGQVILLSTHQDFSLISKPLSDSSDSTQQVSFYAAKKDFKHITHPESFKATLVQVSNAGYRAFLTAHSNMHKIKLSCDNLEQHMDTVKECILEGDNSDIEMFVPDSLDSMLSAADDCTKWSGEIHEGFRKALELLEEVQTSCHATSMTNQEKLKAIEKLKFEIDEKNKNAEIQKKEKEDIIKALEKDINREKELFKKKLEEFQAHDVTKKEIIMKEDDLKELSLKQEQIQRELNKGREFGGAWSFVKGMFSDGHQAKINTEKGEIAKKEKDIEEKKDKHKSMTREIETKNKLLDDKGNCEKEMIKGKQTMAEAVEKKEGERKSALSELDETREKISAQLIRLNNNKVDKLDLEEIKKIIAEGVKQLAELEKRWKMLELFFVKVANILKIAMKGAIKDFSKTASKIKNSVEMSKFAKKQLMKTSFQAFSQCYAAGSVSTTYLMISDKYLMPSIIELGTLLALDSENDSDVIQQKTDEIELRSKDALLYITDIIESAKREEARKLAALK